MAELTCDAVIIGAGHNGLVAANLLADAGWDVIVVEAAPEAGGAVRSSSSLAPGFTTDLFSSYYPMTAASPVMRALELERHGLVWTHAPAVLAHVRPDRPAAVLHRNAARTAAGLDDEHPGDGEAWLALAAEWDRYGQRLLEALLSPFPPVRSALRLGYAARLELWDLARRTILPVRAMAAELFDGDSPGLLLAGNALHADVTPDAAPSALLGWLLVGLGQTVGFPVPVGGAGRITDALLARLARAGGQVRVAEPVEQVLVTGGRATGVRTASGTITSRHAVIAACDAQLLYGRLVDDADLPPSFVARMRQFRRAGATVKVNYALSAGVPWLDARAVDAGTVHLADDLAELTTTSAELANRMVPARPFLLIGQTTTADPTRSPRGTEALWMYTHVPQEAVGDAAHELDVSGPLEGAALDGFVERMEARIEAHAPGFRDQVIAREVQGPGDLQRQDPSLVGGDISGGTTQLHQQLVFRPVPGLARAETPVTGLYLGSSSAHPGGSVHGACGANAARAALLGRRVRTLRRAAAVSAVAAASTAVLSRAARRPSASGEG